jgi:hypothetical protein
MTRFSVVSAPRPDQKLLRRRPAIAARVGNPAAGEAHVHMRRPLHAAYRCHAKLRPAPNRIPRREALRVRSREPTPVRPFPSCFVKQPEPRHDTARFRRTPGHLKFAESYLPGNVHYCVWSFRIERSRNFPIPSRVRGFIAHRSAIIEVYARSVGWRQAPKARRESQGPLYDVESN